MLWFGLALAICGANSSELSGPILQRSLVDMGNTARLQQVMAKARRDEPVTVGVIGGSITAGALASSPEKCWGALTADWWRKTFPKNTVIFVNAGIGATCSDLGAHRVRQHLLDKHPDVVIVEYGVNDMINPIAAETLEGLLRQILSAPQQPAVVLFFTLDHAGNNKQEEHTRIGKHYALPMVSLRDALWPEVQEGRMAWSDFEADEVHPNDAGHAYSAQLLANLFEKVKMTLPEDNNLPPVPAIAAPLISDLFQKTAIFNAASLQPSRNDGWEPGIDDSLFGRGWRADKPGSLLEFTVEGQAVSVLFWRIKGPMGHAQAWVDDRPRVTLEAWFSADWGGYTPFELIARDLAPGTHTLHVRLLSEKAPESNGYEFQLRAVMTAGS